MAQITKSKTNVQTAQETTSKSSWLIRHSELLAPLFLVAAGVISLMSHYLTVSGFTCLTTIVLGLTSIIAGGFLLEHWQRYAWLTVLAATSGAAVGIITLIGQLSTAEFSAAAINSSIILLQMAGALLTLTRLTQPNQ